MKITKIIILINFCLLTVLLLCVLLSGGLFENKKKDYTLKSNTELRPLSMADSLIVQGERIYVYYDSIGGVNVYDLDGSFIYSLSVPTINKGHGGIEIFEGNLHILNNLHEIFVYIDGVFTEKITDWEYQPDLFRYYKEEVLDGVKYRISPLQIYKINEIKEKTVIRNYPVYYILFYSQFQFISFFSLLLLTVIVIKIHNNNLPYSF